MAASGNSKISNRSDLPAEKIPFSCGTKTEAIEDQQRRISNKQICGLPRCSAPAGGLWGRFMLECRVIGWLNE
jgi:hypothetical protein